MRFIFIILALAAYGAYSLMSSFTGHGPAAPASTPAAVAQGQKEAAPLFSLDGLTNMATNAVASAAGVGMQELPKTGCSTSVVPATQVEELLESLPEGQRELLAKLMVSSSVLWTAQVYKGEQGVGLCFPTQEKLLLLPGAASGPAAGLVDLVSGFTQ